MPEVRSVEYFLSSDKHLADFMCYYYDPRDVSIFYIHLCAITHQLSMGFKKVYTQKVYAKCTPRSSRFGNRTRISKG